MIGNGVFELALTGKVYNNNHGGYFCARNSHGEVFDLNNMEQWT